MNAGERDELLAILTLIHSVGSTRRVKGFDPIVKVGTRVRVYKPWRHDLGDPGQLLLLSDGDLTEVAHSLGVCKAPHTEKADVHINGIGVSLKSHRKAPPAIVNHTTRPGWEFAAAQVGVSIAMLDLAVEQYWRMRKSGLNNEDVLNDGAHSPFWDAQSALEPMLAYFMFKGTGTRRSTSPASLVLEFTNPTDLATWTLREPNTVVGEYWKRLVFSVRSDKGMPKNYPQVSARYARTKSSIARWTVYWQDEYRGALHVRVR
jgi:hypothetical protein